MEYQLYHVMVRVCTVQTCNWNLFLFIRNLQAAIGSYYDYEQQPQQGPQNIPRMALVEDITIGEGEAVPPNTPFVKTWRVKNTGKTTENINTIVNEYTKISEVNLYKSTFIYRLFHEDFSLIVGINTV